MFDGETCRIIGRVFSFLEENPENGIERLEQFLQGGRQVLFSTEDVMAMTGWSQTYILRLCKRGDLPYIPGNPHKFMYGPLIEGLQKLLVGGEYGRRKTRLKAKGSLLKTRK
ncbi:MAG: type IV toxin-antitoxin system AbiEi family antitoxin domain-containing protein [Geobacteraceae bacterium]|nr:type IV toxin-antitoxin system AbiEi family antitoxin domain-containing protein [Geobacteraceae bacterium]